MTQIPPYNPPPAYPTPPSPWPAAGFNDGLGTTALVLGILAILFAFVPILGLFAYPLTFLGIIFGLIAVGRARRRASTNRGVSIAGLSTSVAGLFLVILATVFYVGAIDTAVTGASDAVGTTRPGGSLSTSSERASTGSPCAQAYPDRQDTDVCADANQTVVVEGMSVTASPPILASNDLGTPQLCSTITLKNTFNTTLDYNIWDFKLQTPNGDVATGGMTGWGSDLSSGALIAGGVKTGKICGDAPTVHGRHVLIYKPNAFKPLRGIWIFNA
jgi:hypothetical protein